MKVFNHLDSVGVEMAVLADNMHTNVKLYTSSTQGAYTI